MKHPSSPSSTPNKFSFQAFTIVVLTSFSAALVVAAASSSSSNYYSHRQHHHRPNNNTSRRRADQKMMMGSSNALLCSSSQSIIGRMQPSTSQPLCFVGHCCLFMCNISRHRNRGGVGRSSSSSSSGSSSICSSINPDNTRNMYTKNSRRSSSTTSLLMSTKKSSTSSSPTISPLSSTMMQQFTPFSFLNNNPLPSSSLSSVAMSYSLTKEECALPPDTKDNFSRYSKFLVKNSNGVDGMGMNKDDESKESIYWVDTLGELDDDDDCYRTAALEDDNDDNKEASSNSINPPSPFSILSWNILAQTLYESQYQKRKIQQVALSSYAPTSHNIPTSVTKLASTTTSPHPHPWKKRIKRIIDILTHYNSDIICLQECEADSFSKDVLPALTLLGYDGIAQEDDRDEEDKPLGVKQVTKHRYPRNHIVATFWKRDKFEAVGEALVRTRSLAVVLRLKSGDVDAEDGDNVDGDGAGVEEEGQAKQQKEKRKVATQATPTVAVVNVHLEGHPRRFSERTHQLLHALTDISKRIEHEKETLLSAPPTTSDDDNSSSNSNNNRIGKLNALVLAGDFNCELQSSACSTYLRMGRLGKQAGLGGIHGEDSLVLPPSLLETAECTEVIQPIMEWGRALPEDQLADVGPHPFRRRNGMTSAYPVWLGRDDATEHFTFCSELTKRPVPGLDQLWFSSMTLERKALMRNFVDETGLWERYFYDEEEVERMREDERRRVLASGLPSLECKYPSDHLPIGAVFDWNWEDCGDSCLLDDGADVGDDGDANGANGANGNHCVEGVRGLNVIGSEGNDIQDDTLQNPLHQEKKRIQQSFETPHEELDYLLHSCPFDSEEQQSDVQFILSALDPPLCITTKERPTPDQMEQLEARREKKAELLSGASLGVRPWLKDIWKASKQIGKWDRRKEIEKAKLLLQNNEC